MRSDKCYNMGRQGRARRRTLPEKAESVMEGLPEKAVISELHRRVCQRWEPDGKEAGTKPREKKVEKV